MYLHGCNRERLHTFILHAQLTLVTIGEDAASK